MVLGTRLPKGIAATELSLLASEARRSIPSSCIASSRPIPVIVDCPPTDEMEECLEAGRPGSCIPSRSPTSKRLDRRSSITLSTSFSVAELLLPGTLEGQEQPKSLRRQPPQIGWISSHFFFLRLHVQHPVRTRTIRVVRRSGIVHLGREEALSDNGKGRGAADKNRSAWYMWGKTLFLSWSWLRISASFRLIGLCPRVFGS